VLGGKRLTIYNSVYPDYAIAIGWIIVAAPLSLIVGCAVAQAYIYKFNWV
jgi:hypothetical protein